MQAAAVAAEEEEGTRAARSYCITFEDVKEAAKRIEGIAHRTPVLTSRSLMMAEGSDGGDGGRHQGDDGKTYFFKVEAMQKTGSFKFRGALNAVKAELEARQSAATASSSTMPIVTHRSGNHAQALALAARLASTEATRVTATIVMPRNAPVVKREAVIAFGADIVTVDSTNEAREGEADRIVASTGAVFVHPSESPAVIAGQGTACLEFVDQVRLLAGEDLDAVIIPVGGGGLASGSIISLRGMLGGRVKIVLAEPANLDDAKRSFDGGTLLGHSPDNGLDSVADGLKTTLGPNTWPIVRDLADDIFTVSEEDILRATKLVWERLKVAIEPSAGVGVAVARSRQFNEKYTTASGIKNVGVILCGGNVDILMIAAKMSAMGL
jgi:threonine dehydratase